MSPNFFQAWDCAISMCGVFNTCAGFLVMGIVGYNPFLLVAIINSASIPLAYGLAWHSGDYPQASAGMVAFQILGDIFWLIQEASLSFYSFLIVRKIVRGRERILYLVVFWFLVFCICACRVPIMASRIESALKGESEALNNRVSNYHAGYFASIALCETWNAIFLLKTFYKAKTSRRDTLDRDCAAPNRNNSRSGSMNGRFAFKKGLYSHLFRSSEIRLASLAGIGIMRSFTYPLGNHGNPISKLDSFVCSMEVMFPGIFLIDILASKLAYYEQTSNNRFAPTDLQTSSDRTRGGENSADFDNHVSKTYPHLANYDSEEPKRDIEAVITEVPSITTRHSGVSNNELSEDVKRSHSDS